MENSSDFKLLDRIVVDAITRALPERQRFYRGLSDWVGYPHASIPFDVEERAEGQGKWSLWGLLGLATTAIITFTSAPLRIVTALGFATLLFGFVVAAEALLGMVSGASRVGLHDDHHHLADHRQLHHDQPGHHRRVHRQDLRRDQASARLI